MYIYELHQECFVKYKHREMDRANTGQSMESIREFQKKNLSTSKSPEILSTASVFLKNEWKMPRFHSTASKSEWNSIKWIIRFSFKRDSVEFRWVWPFSMFMKSKLWLRCRKGVTSIEKNVLFVRKITFHWIISADTICIHYSSFALIFVMGRQML